MADALSASSRIHCAVVADVLRQALRALASADTPSAPGFTGGWPANSAGSR